MNTRAFIHNPEELLKEGTKIINSSSDAKYILRVAMVNFMLAKTATAEELSTLSGIPRRTLTSWVQKVDENGFESLRAIKQPGRSSRLSEDQMAIIKDAIEADPEDSGYRVWDGTTLSDFIKEQFGIDLGVRQCQRLFHSLGFSKIRPQKYPSLEEQNEEAREDFKKTKGYSKNRWCQARFSG
jgi:transposase